MFKALQESHPAPATFASRSCMRTHPTSWFCVEKGSKSQAAFGTSAQQLDGFPAKKKSHHISAWCIQLLSLFLRGLGCKLPSYVHRRLFLQRLVAEHSVKPVVTRLAVIKEIPCSRSCVHLDCAFINPSAVPGCTKPFNWLSRSLNHSGSWTSEPSISTAMSR